VTAGAGASPHVADGAGQGRRRNELSVGEAAGAASISPPCATHAAVADRDSPPCFNRRGCAGRHALPSRSYRHRRALPECAARPTPPRHPGLSAPFMAQACYTGTLARRSKPCTPLPALSLPRPLRLPAQLHLRVLALPTRSPEHCEVCCIAQTRSTVRSEAQAVAGGQRASTDAPTQIARSRRSRPALPCPPGRSRRWRCSRARPTTPRTRAGGPAHWLRASGPAHCAAPSS
jgi:hypothetical protein